MSLALLFHYLLLNEWRLKTNEELEEAVNNESIVRYIKYKRLGWLGRVERMTNEIVAKTIYK